VKTLHLWLEQVGGFGKSLDPEQKKEGWIQNRGITEVVKDWPY